MLGSWQVSLGRDVLRSGRWRVVLCVLRRMCVWSAESHRPPRRVIRV